MNIDNIEKIELEITSDCNAACPGCARTFNKGKFEVTHFGVDDLKRIFPKRSHIENKLFKLCGVLGDPIVNPECLEMVKYIVENGGHAHLSTNGAYNTVEWWNEIGTLSKKTNRVQVFFAVDGHKETNHIYRINTKWSVLERNMQAYADAGGKGRWVFIVFDHNEHELEPAMAHAKKLGFNFATRTGMRNSYHQWVSKTKKKENNNGKKEIVEKEQIITTTGKKEHSKKEKVLQIDKIIAKTDQGLSSKQEQKNLIQTVTCKLIHQGEIFISAKQELWPCCFLSDSTVWNKDNIIQKLSEYETDWNSLKTQTIDEILQHPWFDKILQESWDFNHEKHLHRCIKTCGYNQAYHNEQQWVSNE